MQSVNHRGKTYDKSIRLAMHLHHSDSLVRLDELPLRHGPATNFPRDRPARHYRVWNACVTVEGHVVLQSRSPRERPLLLLPLLLFEEEDLLLELELFLLEELCISVCWMRFSRVEW